ncbi:glycoside hydrolase family 3 protein [Saccharopolyspora sp. 5N102]|uniref:glycoside hydrolase family 3 protein n=1 Tax=Saccharopolyspora sp. 5N102 TaxID=3375155 RepID=UPI00379071F1
MNTDVSSAPDRDRETTRIRELIEQLTLQEKVGLLTGRDFWTTHPIERIGLRAILFSDGPSGVRGEAWDEREPSLNLPSSTALSSAWDQDLAWRYGAALAVEAHRKGVDVVLGPTINLHRSPLGGRHFEAFSEDPALTAELTAAYVAGLQDNGVGATPKHYVANDYETDRFTANTVVSDRALRELYLLPFEKAVIESHAWLVMSAYNSINGATATENELLETPLCSEWGFDGVVISDWTAVRSLNSARYSQDLVMPGPAGPWGDALVAAVRSGSLGEEVVDRKVERLLRLAARVGALEGFEPARAAPGHVEDGIALGRQIAAAGAVLVKNEGILPLQAGSLSSVAVIGHNALFARTQGGGSATVLPERVSSPLDGIREALPNASVSYAVGAVVQEGVAELPLPSITNPAIDAPGVRARFLKDGEELFAEDRRSTSLVWFGGDAPIAESDTLELHTRYVPPESGRILLGFASIGTTRVYVDGQLAHQDTLTAVGNDLGAALLAPPSSSFALNATAGTPVELRIEHDLAGGDREQANALSFTLGTEPDHTDPQALIDEAVANAAAADVAVLVVGTNSEVESEGHDRDNLRLPGYQDDLVRAVLAANPRTVVVVNSGAPVVLPWQDASPAILLTWFGGQEYGHALADVLFGSTEPGGRLPTTWPKAQEDVPILDVTPVDGDVRYDEDIHIGYRAWLKADTEPAWHFGHGLGYTTFDFQSVEAAPTISTDSEVTVRTIVRNTGSRRGKCVVQVYATRPESEVDRPVRWLVGFASVLADPDQTVQAEVRVPARAFAHWDQGWQYETGPFQLLIGSNVNDLPLATAVTVK